MKRLLSLIVLLLLTPSPLAAQVVNASRIHLNGTWVTVGSASPESSVTGSPGDLYIRTNGSLYIKATGSNTNTGWSLMAAGTSSGTVTSVGLSLPGTFSVSGSPVTTSGTLTASFAAQSAKTFFSGPSSGSAATPTWRQPQLTDLGQAAATVNQIVAWDGTQWAPADNTGGGGAPVGAQYLTLATDGTLTNERVLTAGTGVTLTDAGAGSTLTVAADGANITSLNASNLASGTVSASRMPALTGDVTTSAGAVATTLANDAVTNAKAANMAQSTIKGRAVSAGTGDPTDLSATQATAILDVVVGDSGSGGTKGLVPAPASGDAAAGKFLKADGTFAVPPGSGGTGTVTHTGALTSGKVIQGNGTDDVTVSTLTATVANAASGTLGTATPGTDYVAPGAVTTSGLTQATGKLLGRSTASTGAIEEITVSTGLSLSGGSLTATATSGGLVWLHTYTPSSAASVDITSILSSTYDRYLVQFDAMVPASGTANLVLLYSVDNGSNWIATNYLGGLIYVNNNGTTGVNNTITTNIRLNENYASNTSANGGVSGYFVIGNVNSATQAKQVTVSSTNINGSDSLFYSSNGGGQNSGTTAVTAALTALQLKFQESGGTNRNIASGTVTIFGYAK